MFEGIKSHWWVLRQAWRRRRELTTRTRRSRVESEFLPGALEVQDKPPSPFGRLILWSIVLLFFLAVAWATFGRIDVVATAQGKIVPTGEIKVIQPREIGRIQALHVREGEHVDAGDVLVELDPAVSMAEEKRLSAMLAQAKALTKRLRIQADYAAAVIEQDRNDTPPQVTGDDGLTRRQSRLLVAKISELRSQLDTLHQEAMRHTSDLASSRENVRRLRQSLPLISERAEGAKILADKNYIARTQFLEVEQQRLDQTRSLAVEQKRISSLRSRLSESYSKQAQTKATFYSQTLAELDDARNRVSELEQRLVKASERSSWQTLRAPVTGVVQQLAIHTIGGIVEPAQELMVIVPDGDRLEVRAWLKNKDVGFVHAGDPVEIKLETFPFTKYGAIDGELVDISNDAISKEKLGLVYAVRVLMQRTDIQVGDRLVKLTPGMAATVEIKTGQRRIVEYFLSPLLRYGNESLKER